LNAKSEENKKFKAELAELKAELADLAQKHVLSQAAEQEAQLQRQKQEQDLQQLQNQLQEAKQQYQLLQEKHQQATIHKERIISDLKRKLAQSIHTSPPVAAVADLSDNGVAVGTSNAFSLASSALPPAAFSASASLNTAASECVLNVQIQPAASSAAAPIVPVPAFAFNPNSAADTENPGDKRSSDNVLVGPKQTKRVRLLY
jgi:hypothetical protein